MFKCSNVQMFECSNVQMFECSNVECSNVQMFKCHGLNLEFFSLGSQVFDSLRPYTLLPLLGEVS